MSMAKRAGPDDALIASLVLSADHGDGEAALALGRLYADPNCVLYDAALARKYLSLAALQGYTGSPNDPVSTTKPKWV